MNFFGNDDFLGHSGDILEPSRKSYSVFTGNQIWFFIDNFLCVNLFIVGSSLHESFN